MKQLICLLLFSMFSVCALDLVAEPEHGKLFSTHTIGDVQHPSDKILNTDYHGIINGIHYRTTNIHSQVRQLSLHEANGFPAVHLLPTDLALSTAAAFPVYADDPLNLALIFPYHYFW